jgi:hypothetical protein
VPRGDAGRFMAFDEHGGQVVEGSGTANRASVVDDIRFYGSRPVKVVLGNL